MTSETGPSLWQQRTPMFKAFTHHMASLLEYGGVRSDLRPAVRKGPDQALAANRHILRWAHNEGADYADLLNWRRVRETLLLTAGLMAHFPKSTTLAERWERHRRQASDTPRRPRLDLGLALAEADRKDGKTPGGSSPDKMTPREKRLLQLCRSDRDRLPRHLFTVLSYLHGQQSPLPEWSQLAIDIEHRLRAPDAVARRWQESYLRRPPWRSTRA